MSPHYRRKESSRCQVLGLVLTALSFEKISLAIAIPPPLLFLIKLGVD